MNKDIPTGVGDEILRSSKMLSLSASITDVLSLKIDKKFYKNESNRKVAKKCLSLCNDWIIVNQESITNDSLFLKPANNYKIQKASCKKYVRQHLNKDGPYGNFLLSMLFSVLVRLIIEWVVENYIKDLIAK